MRRAMLFGIGAAMLTALPAAAAVPPHLQRRDQLRQIVALPVLNRLGPIDRIELVAPDRWRVTAGRCHLDIRLVPRGRVAPGRQIALEPGDPVCQR